MKKIIVITSIFLFSTVLGWAQKNNHINYPMLGEDAPSFVAQSTSGTVNFPSDYTTDWKIIFSHPADFTPVCSSEIMELATEQSEFDKLGVKIVVVSVDNLETHKNWVKNMEKLRYNSKDPVKISFPLVSDDDLVISKEYGMIQPNASSTKDVRGVFIVDPKNKIRAIFFYPMNIGRNIAEIERTILALQTADKQMVCTPANWQQGGDVLVPYAKPYNGPETLAATDDAGDYQLTWYMRYKKEK
jgi:peroxiredoxin 2/4